MTIHSRTTLRLLPSLLLLATACPDDTGTTTEGTSGTGTTTAGDTDLTTTPSGDPTGDPDPTTPTTSGGPTTSTDATSSTGPATATDSGTTTDGITTTDGTTTDGTTTDGTTTDGTTTDGTTTDGTTTDGTTGAPVTTLCERLGNPEGIGLLVGDFLGKVLQDDKINGYFLNSDVDGGALGACVVDQLGEAVGCEGVVYGCKDMKSAHAGLKISNIDFTDFAVDFAAALDDHQTINAPDLTDDDKTTILGVLGGMIGDIVEDPTDDATVYQRVGRKPAIQTLIGLPGDAGSFVDNVAMNPEINGFFAGTDFERLRTCLTRQVAGIDGPTKYGLEVDAPPGIDPGVSMVAPCKDMVSSHAGLQDDEAMAIMYDDFVALVTDLVTAMDTAGVDPADQAAILGVLGPMCVDIVGPPGEKNKCPGNSETQVLEAKALAKTITDNAYNGTLASMICQSFVVADDELDFVTGVKLTTGIAHTAIGDLVIKVEAPGGEVLTVLSRPGLAEVADDGLGCCGSNSDFVPSSPISFYDAALIDAETMGPAAIVCQTDMECDFFPNPGKGPGTKFSQFTGDTAVGTWRVCVADAAGAFTGTLQDITLTLDQGKFKP